MRKRLRPFRAVDGEGAVPDAVGRQDYNLLVCGRRVLRPDIRSYITSGEVFEFLLDLPAEPILVGYYIGYDVTMWLRDVPAKKVERLLIEDKKIFGNYTYWCDWGLQYIPGQFFRVCRLDKEHQPIEGSARTVNEVSGFFRGPFLDALATMQAGTAGELAEIRTGKAKRGVEAADPVETERYCKLECRLLAKAMERLRDLCTDADLLPHSWRGAGQLASRLLKDHDIPQRPKQPTRPARIDVSHEDHRYPDDSQWRRGVMTAYFGGRIENRAVGNVPGPVWSYDKHSAYPAAMLDLPCPRHTDWVKFKGEPKGFDWFLAKGKWHDDRTRAWGFLPARTPQQSIIYPTSCAGCWWSPELRDLPGFECRTGWGANRNCDCHPFQWLQELFTTRQQFGNYRGLPIKIAMAALYGKLGQRKHMNSARWRDLIQAGLITSIVRRQIRDVLDVHGDSVLAIATDGILASKRLPLDFGPGLGQWSEECLPDGVFLVQPGIFWTPDRTMLKARGFTKATMRAACDTLETKWAAAPPWQPPSHDMPIDLFIGHKAAQQLGNADLAGTWRKMRVPLSFDWRARRAFDAELVEGANYVVTHAPQKHRKSAPYDPSMISEMEKVDQILREQPDGV